MQEYGTLALLHSPPQGMEPLRRAISDYLNLERGAHATLERVLVLTSSQQALTLCATALFDAGERIYIEDPFYYGARKAFDAAGLACVPVPLDADGMRVEHLRDAMQPAKAVFLTPSHQFPTGATLALDRRLAVIEWVRQHQAWIIEGDYDSEFHYAGKPTACVQRLDPHERTIDIGTSPSRCFPACALAT
ncbi:aminotransferase-like domain-containing protein [Stutzerimonas nitrititolerans]|uniref:aminotransferase-like domain-containing protein n=1 Tax=Stutzerimonas nitrititolerans TaxID=2482751 RepID=UPI0028B23E08|nr:PLP-dependent aminotransferase family protein [Stutzerimonas nitrititolerans]